MLPAAQSGRGRAPAHFASPDWFTNSQEKGPVGNKAPGSRGTGRHVRRSPSAAGPDRWHKGATNHVELVEREVGGPAPRAAAGRVWGQRALRGAGPGSLHGPGRPDGPAR